MPFLDVPSTSQSSSALSEKPPNLKLSQKERDAPRYGAKLQEVSIIPQPGFVVKTALQTAHISTSASPLTKLFINVSGAVEVPSSKDEKSNPLCAVGAVENTVDKAGQRSLVIDATLNELVLNKTKKDKNYKQWLIQWVLEKVEEKMGVELSRNYTEPNIKVKGELKPRRAVLPIPVLQPSQSGHIQVIDDNYAPPLCQAQAVQFNTDQSKALIEPKHDFEVVDNGLAFIFTMYVPDEPLLDAQPSPSLTLTASTIHFRSSRYVLDMNLPMEIDTESRNLEEAEWSKKEKAVRIYGRLLQK